MWARKRLDIGWSDLAFGLLQCCVERDLLALQRRVEAAWSDSGDALVCLSVRSGFDLLLDAWELPAGSEVLMSALTIGDMPRIVEEHSLVPIPVDLDVDHLAPRVESLERAITPATRAVVVAHLFGNRIPLEPILQVARRHGLLVVEDYAQAFDGRCRGHPAVDASLFSFGVIKTATALHGAILQVRDREVLKRIRRRQADYPAQKAASFLKRILKCAALKAVSARPVFGMLFLALLAARCDVDRLLNRAARGFPGPDLLRQIRQRPSPPLLALLERRLRKFDDSRLAQRTAKGQLLAKRLGNSVTSPGNSAAIHSHWVFPILADDPPRVIAVLRKAGFDATQGSSMCVVRAPPGRPELFPVVAAELLNRILYLPFHADMPVAAIERMAKVVCSTSQGGCPIFVGRKLGRSPTC